MHLNGESSLKVGDTITGNTQVGKMGGSGNGSLSAYDVHLHYQLMRNGAIPELNKQYRPIDSRSRAFLEYMGIDNSWNIYAHVDGSANSDWDGQTYYNQYNGYAYDYYFNVNNHYFF
jgi:hypothetical protein